MNASIVQRLIVILGSIAVPWVGCSLWSAHRERAAKDALAAEIRAEIAARPRGPDRTAGRRDLTAEYDAVLAGLGSDKAFGELGGVLQDPAPWTGVPKAVRSALADHAAALDALDALAAKGEPGWMRCFGGTWKPWLHLRLLLAVRGRTCIVQGDWDGLLRAIRALRRAADDALASFVLPDWAIAGTAGSLEDEALALMALAAVDPALTEAAAADLLAVASGTWTRGEAFDAMRDCRRSHSDDLCLELLGPEALAVMKRSGILGSDDFFDRMERLLPGRPGREPDRLQPTAPPSAEVVREMRAIYRRYHDAEARRDVSAIALGGELDLDAVRDLGGLWTGGHASAYPVWSRFRWKLDARLPVLRAAFAIRIHEAQKGHVPATLERLVPSILDAVPVDAWTGKPVVFTPGPGAGWLLEAGPPVASFDHAPGAKETTEPWRLRK